MIPVIPMMSHAVRPAVVMARSSFMNRSKPNQILTDSEGPGHDLYY
jgi:hypothetical protein